MPTAMDDINFLQHNVYVEQLTSRLRRSLAQFVDVNLTSATVIQYQRLVEQFLHCRGKSKNFARGLINSQSAVVVRKDVPHMLLPIIRANVIEDIKKKLQTATRSMYIYSC